MRHKGGWVAMTLALVWVLVAAWVPVLGAREGVAASSLAGGAKQAVEPGGVPNGLTGEEWGRIREMIRGAEYQYTWHTPSAAFVAPNRAHGLVTALDAEGLRVSPAIGQRVAGWGWQMRLAGWGTAGEMRAVGDEPVVRLEGGRVQLVWDQGLTEWYANDARGIEQGFTIQWPPEGVGREEGLVLEMAVATELSPRLAEDDRGVVFADGDGRTVLRYADLHVTDATGKVVPSRLEVHLNTPDAARYALCADMS